MGNIPAISQVLIDLIVKMYKEGVQPVKIAKELRIDEVTVHKYLTRTGARTVSDKVRKESAKRVGDTLDDDISELYTAGLAVKEIAVILDISVDTLYRRTRLMGLTRKPSNEKYTEAIRLMTEQKKTMPEVAELTGFSEPTLYRLLKKYKETGTI